MSVSRSREDSDALGGIVNGYAPLDSGLLVPRAYLPQISGLLHNMDATTVPTANDDSGDGYGVGSRWLDVTNDNEYVCADASSGAAVWLLTGGLVGASIYKASDQTNLDADAFVKITYSNAAWDSHGFFDDANDRLTIPSAMAGKYLVTGNWSLYNGTSASTDMQVALYKNGTSFHVVDRRNVAANEWPTSSFAIAFNLVATDYIELWIDCGGFDNVIDARGGQGWNNLQITLLGV